MPGQEFDTRRMIDRLTKTVQHVTEAIHELRNASFPRDVALVDGAREVQLELYDIISSALGYFLGYSERLAYLVIAQALEAPVLYEEIDPLDSLYKHFDHALNELGLAAKGARELEAPEEFINRLGNVAVMLERFKDVIYDAKGEQVSAVERLRRIAFHLKAISDQQRFFDMYATFVIKSDSPEAEAIFVSEVDHNKKLLLGAILRVLIEQITILHDAFYLVFMDHVKDVGEYMKDSDLQRRIKILLPKMDPVKEYHKMLEFILDLWSDDDGAITPEKAQHAAERAWSVVWKRKVKEGIADRVAKIVDTPRGERRTSIPLDKIKKILEGLDFPPQPWVDITALTKQLQGASGESAFQTIDRLVDVAHHRGTLGEYIGLFLPWFTKEILDIKSNAKLSELRPYTSPEVSKLIYEQMQMGRVSHEGD